MSSKGSIRPVEDIVGYKFKSKPLLLKALTAAGSELSDYDGNRRLAQLGTALVEFLLVYIGYRQNVPRGYTTRFKIRFGSNEHCAAVIKRTGIDSYISYSSKPGVKAPTVLAKSVNVIIAATFVDSRDISVALRTMLRLGVLVEENGCINPRLLTLDPGEACGMIYSLTNLLIGGDPVDDISPSEGCIMPSQLFNDFGLDPLAIEDETLCSTVAEYGYNPVLKSNLETEQGGGSSNILQRDQSNMADLTRGRNQHQDTTYRPEASPLLNTQNKESQAQARNIVSEGIARSSSAQHHKGARTISDNAFSRGNAIRKKRLAKLVENYTYRKKPVYALQTIGDRLEQYLLHEIKKCKAQGIRPPSETFFTPYIRERVLSLGNGTIDILGMTVATIASAQSIVTLQEALRYKRAQTGYALRYHILELFEECGSPGNRWNSGFIHATPLDFKQATKKSGNLANNADSKVTKTMIHKCFPEVQQAAENYVAKYRAIKRLRKLGERFHFITEKFGRGVLGLLLDGKETHEQGVTVSRILAVSDTRFAEFVSVLDISQGATLREFSNAVLRIVNALLYGTLPDIKTTVERAETKDILACTKGSQALLSFLQPL
ncbi:hypothetical protein TEQG_03222 [Trichophyton equinum CBS 127.97]|uniref:RNase III domain-containing protein n=1 Tax=Trichophyton equinum (strain ATCC MYA-4606 / CBS 127.97) TaxID=559882 RepID=F2PQM3_TRIEC|nr:hypothetical protein TEQG_03222 [Trichophyton equinum CBS 127.97]